MDRSGGGRQLQASSVPEWGDGIAPAGRKMRLAVAAAAGWVAGWAGVYRERLKSNAASLGAGQRRARGMGGPLGKVASWTPGRRWGKAGSCIENEVW